MLTVAAIAAIVVTSAVLWRSRVRQPAGPAPTAQSASRQADAAAGEPGSDAAAAPAPDPGSDEVEDMETPWAAVDLNALRAELPDNLFWKMASPTTDPAIIEEREAERARWNVEYGKVLSNTATPDEIDTYYAYRYRLSSDYVQFATYLLSDYGDKLAARDVGLLKVAVELHLARLEEIPRQITEAHERAAAHAAARQAWLESEKLFENGKK
jgi:hypothetical protein